MMQKIAIIGAGGKMGAGITLLMLLLPNSRIKAIDVSESALDGLKNYLKQQLVRHAEKSINQLRKSYESRKDLISNEEMIENFTWESLDRIDFSTHLEDAEGAGLIFEAAVENIDSKVEILKKIRSSSSWIFTNTSSIPISLLNEKAHLNNRIAGFHFYNPPPVQKLVEVIELQESPIELKELIKDLGNKLQKTLVYSNDIAGFIGNGYFMREIVYSFKKWKELGSSDFGLQQIESVTKNFLLRPMGIFQLMDYVGLDVVKNILSIMKDLLPDPELQVHELDEWLSLGIKGGQKFNGQQKDGIFQYENGLPKALFSLTKKKYIPLEDDLLIGVPPGGLNWKTAVKNKEAIPFYFADLLKDQSLGSILAQDYLKEGKRIANLLVSSHVAHSLKDVEVVLKNGFYHLYEKF